MVLASPLVAKFSTTRIQTYRRGIVTVLDPPTGPFIGGRGGSGALPRLGVFGPFAHGPTDEFGSNPIDGAGAIGGKLLGGNTGMDTVGWNAGADAAGGSGFDIAGAATVSDGFGAAKAPGGGGVTVHGCVPCGGTSSRFWLIVQPGGSVCPGGSANAVVVTCEPFAPAFTSRGLDASK